MKKFFCSVLALAMLLCAGCTAQIKDSAESDDSTGYEPLPFSGADSMPSDKSSYAPKENTESSESTCDGHCDSEATPQSASDSSENSALPSSQDAAPDFSDITAQIAAMDNECFVTNISESKALEDLRACLEDTSYGFFYCDLEYKGFAAYGCNRVFKAASTCKLPYIKYLCTLADSGALDPNEGLCFEERHRTAGSGIMKNAPSGSVYTVRTLMDYTLRYSDNIAYSMLIERFGLKDYLQAVRALGVPYDTRNGYANCTAAQMAALLFDAASYNGANLRLMLDPGCNASYNHQIGAELREYKVLQKFGAIKPGNVAYHDIAVVYAQHPYILVIYTTIDYDSPDKNVPFRRLARLTDNLNKTLYENAEQTR